MTSPSPHRHQHLPLHTHRKSLIRRALRKASVSLTLRANQGLDAFINTKNWLRRDPADLVDQTPYNIILQNEKLIVRHYLPLTRQETKHRKSQETTTPPLPPVLLVPPLMVRPFIFDLTKTRSFVRTLLEEGLDVFLVDFGEPDQSDAEMTLDDYVLDWMPQAVNATCAAAEVDALSMIGYCQGGLFALMHTSANEDPRVRGIVTIGTPIDTDRMGPVVWLLRIARHQADFVVGQLGNIPGELSSSFFKLMSPMKSLTRYSGLFLNLHNQEYINDFDALNQWTGNFIDYPKAAFRQLMLDFMADNQLKHGEMHFGNKVADLTRIQCPVLVFAGASDNIVPIGAAKALLDLVSSKDTELRVVPGGHMGIFAGKHAPDEVWRYSAGWLRKHPDLAL